MSKCSEIRQRLVALRTEAATLLNTADKEAEGVLTAEQADRMDAITTERTELEAKLDTEITALEADAGKLTAEYDRGVFAGWEAAVAAVEVCAVANVPATRVLGFVKDKASADDVRKAVLAERTSGTEISARHSSANADKPASWDKAVAKANARVKTPKR